MPIINRTKDIVLFFYGEHHADTADIQGLISEEHDNVAKNARYVLHLYEKNGQGFLRQLNGWYHGVIVDLRTREIKIFNDRFGIQRLYYFKDEASQLFASEAKAILKVRKDLRRLDPQSVGELLSCDCVLEGRTLFSNLHTLPPASIWKFSNCELQKKASYFNQEEWEKQSVLSMEELYERLEALFPRVMARYLNGGLPIGVSLSGGLDTRQVMANIDHERYRIPCYTFKGMHRESFDVKLARKVAVACGQHFETLQLDKDYLNEFPESATRTIFLSDGCLSACGSYELYLNKLARNVAPVRLTGNFGSEVFRDLWGVKAIYPDTNLIHPDYHRYLQQAMHTFEQVSDCHNLSFCVFRQAPWHGYGRLAVEQSQVVLRTPFLDNDLIGLMYQASTAARSTTQLQWQLIAHENPTLVKIPTDRGLRGHQSMLSSRWAYLRTYFQFKADYLYKSGMPQWLEKIHYFLGPLSPERLIIGSHRFTHFRIWFRNELAGFIKEVLLSPRTLQRPHVKKDVLESMVLRHIKGERNYTYEIEKMLTMELIYRQFIEGDAFGPTGS